ncbi:MAG: hypothetical protein IKD71_05405 [Solobacterium sp.]|nr:hypothetical protein [Solobacterium sp.]
MVSLFVVVLTGLLFLLALVSLGFQPKINAKLSGWLLFFTAVSGACIYGYGYSVIFHSIPQAVMRALFSVFCMFLGRNEISAVSAAPAFQNPAAQVFIYLVHLTALYCTASAVLTTIGSRLLKVLNLALINRKDVYLIYGVNDDSVSFAEMLQTKDNVVVFAGSASNDKEGQIVRMGSILFSDPSAREADEDFVRRTGMHRGNRKLQVYCLDEDPGRNIKYAKQLCESLKSLHVLPENTRLTLITDDAYAAGILQNDEKRNVYGYGSVFAFDRAELVARLMVRTYPPYRTMTFGDDGTAQENFEAVVVGFGNVGQAALRSLLMNAQFCGSRFHAVVIADSYNARSGSFNYRYPGIQQDFNVEFREENARSISFYNYLYEKRSTLNYIAVCTGNEKENNEIAGELTEFLRDAGSKADIVQCSASGVSRFSYETGITTLTRLLSPEILDHEKMDRMAMILNHQYHLEEGRSVEEDWKDCDYFSRMSCRASADFMDAVLFSCGTSGEKVLRNGFEPDEHTLDVLGQTEHLRWWAFHASMGYQRMPEEEIRQRGELYRKQKAEGSASLIRITKDDVNRRHACMIGWELLDSLAEQEAQYTGIRKDYKKMDIDNIRMIPGMLREVQNEEK